MNDERSTASHRRDRLASQSLCSDERKSRHHINCHRISTEDGEDDNEWQHLPTAQIQSQRTFAQIISYKSKSLWNLLTVVVVVRCHRFLPVAIQLDRDGERIRPHSDGRAFDSRWTIRHRGLDLSKST